jgi:hypothetical protein
VKQQVEPVQAPGPLAPAPLAFDNPLGEPTPRDNGFRFPPFSDDRHRFWYAEYWYFNFTDPASGRSGLIGFGVVNPGNVGLVGRAVLTVALLEPGRPSFDTVDLFPLLRFWASEERADVTIGHNVLRSLDDRTIEIQASTRNGRVRANLVYTQADAPLWLSKDARGPLPWESNWWLPYMPCARIQGQILWDGRAVTIDDGVGYHDHSWGSWLIPARPWAWGHLALPAEEISCVLGYKTGFDSSQVYFRHRDLRLVFPDQRQQWTAGQWQPWRRLWRYPSLWRLEAVDAAGEHRLSVGWRVRATTAVSLSPILLLEQQADFRGTLQRRTPDGGWAEAVRFQGPGPAEWVVPYYEPIWPTFEDST